jgi:predicted ArsR family transcriptional regulator
MSATALTDTSRSVLASLYDHQQATAPQLASELGIDLCDVYAALVQLHDHEKAAMRNAHHEYRRKTGRACIWSPT